MSDKNVFYLSAYVRDESVLGKQLEVQPTQANAILHVYTISPDELAAGAVLADICSRMKLEFEQFIYPPAIESRETVFRSPEFETAFDLAFKEGISFVISFIFTGRGQNTVFVDV